MYKYELQKLRIINKLRLVFMVISCELLPISQKSGNFAGQILISELFGGFLAVLKISMVIFCFNLIFWGDCKTFAGFWHTWVIHNQCNWWWRRPVLKPILGFCRFAILVSSCYWVGSLHTPRTGHCRYHPGSPHTPWCLFVMAPD